MSWNIPNILIEARKNSGGGGGGAPSANDVSYNNTDSGLAAENVQTAIDEVVGDLSELNDKVDATPTNYSTTERIIGRWIDNKPIYQRTWELPTAVDVGVDWTDIEAVVIPNVKRIIYIEGSGTAELPYGFPLIGAHDGSFLQCCSSRTSDNAVKFITVRYTKTTD